MLLVAAGELVKLTSAYVSSDLGRLAVERRGATVRFRVAAWSSAVASRHNDDGTTSFITVDPGLSGLDFVAGMSAGKRTLTTRDGQHTYVFNEDPTAADRAQ